MMERKGILIKVTVLVCVLVLLCTSLTGCNLLRDFLGNRESQPTESTEPLENDQVQLLTTQQLQVYNEPDPNAQVVGLIQANTQIVIVATVPGFTAGGADATWGKLMHDVGWVILYADEDSQTPTVAPTEPQEPTIYNTRLLPQSATRSYSQEEILVCLTMWLEAGYTYDEALSLARNEIYADHGYGFSDSEYRRYFYGDRAALYGEGEGLNAQQAQQLLTESQRKNVETLQKMEAKCAAPDTGKQYMRKLLPESARKQYSRQEVLVSLLPWLQDGYYLQEALMLACNEIFANYGYAFGDDTLRYYFDYAHPHLYPEATAGKDVSSLLNAKEISNVDMLRAWQDQCKEPASPSHPTPDYRWPVDSGDGLVVDMVDAAIASPRYHLPYVNGAGYEKVNQAIRSQLMTHASEIGWDDIGYSVGYKGDAVSILVRCEGFSDDSAYYTYHFARSTGELLERADVLRQFGLNAQTFCELAEERTLDCFESYYQELKDNSDPSLYEDLWEITKEGTLDNTQVFVDRNGNLGFVARIGAIAGATYDNQVLGCWEDAPVEDVNFYR